MAAPKHLRQLARSFAGRTPDLSAAVVTGATSTTDITLTGIDPGDLIVAVLQIDTSWSAKVANVTKHNTIRTTTDTSTKQLLVLWWHRNPKGA